MNIARNEKSAGAKPSAVALAASMLLAAASPASAQTPELDPSATAWTLTSSALVLLMLLPGLALFYAGLVRQKNVLSVMMHCVAIGCVGSIAWCVAGYSIAFEAGNPLVGGLGKALLAGVDRTSQTGAIPEIVFFLFQMTFAIITPALIVGAFVERVKFPSVVLFSALWLLAVYAPVCHWIWGGGWLAERGAMDFAGGIVVHTTAGVSALVFAAMLGPRDGFPRELHPPHSPGLTMMGAALLWVGWYGFNGGSALAASADAGMAIVATHLAASAGGIVWACVEHWRFGRPSLMGAVTGVIAGLATVTPASGFISPMGGILLGAAGGLVCFAAVDIVKRRMKIDDSLDVFAVHGVGGILGSLLVALLAAEANGGTGYPDATGGAQAQFGVQALAVAATAAWSAIASWIILLAADALFGLRADKAAIQEGLDITAHGERATPD